MRILANIGSDAVAGATIAIHLMVFTLMPAWGLFTPWLSTRGRWKAVRV